MIRLAALTGATVLVLCSAVPAMASATGPVAADDEVVTQNKVAHLDVLANDTAPGGTLDVSTLRIASSPSHGDAIVIASGSPKVKYTAYGSEATSDTFRYEICDTDGACAIATVTINFSGEPVATPSTTLTTIATTVSISVTTSTGVTTTTAVTGTTAPDPDPIAVVAVDPLDSTVTTSGSTVATAAFELSTVTIAGPVTSTPNVHALGELTLGSNSWLAAGTTIGEARSGLVVSEDFPYLGRSGLETVALVATPALMVSGVVGFLMIGLPQNAFATVFGFLVGWRRKNDPPSDHAGKVTDLSKQE